MNLEAPWIDQPFAVVDVETTGLDPATDRIIEIAVVHMRAGEIEDQWSTLVDPQREVPEEVLNITGIKAEDLVGAPRFAAVADEVFQRLQGRGFVAYNLPFDRAFVRNELERHGLDFGDPVAIDPLVFVRKLHAKQGSKRLGAVAERLGIPLDNAHRAADDAIVAGKVLYAIASELPTHLGDLRMLQEQWAQQQKNEMAAWRSRRGNTIDDDVTMTDRGNALGPAYIYGDDTDPIRAMFIHLPDSGGRRA